MSSSTCDQRHTHVTPKEYAYIKHLIQSQDHAQLRSLAEVPKQAQVALDLIRKRLSSSTMDECSSLTALTSAWWRDLLELSAVCSWRVFESVNIARPLEPVRTGLWTVTQIPTGSKEQCGGKAVAVKALDLPLALLSVSKEEAEKNFYTAADRWMTLSHPHILPVLGINRSGSNTSPSITIPWMRDGNIISHLRNARSHDKLTGSAYYHRLNTLLLHVALGLACLHSNDIVHGALQSSNVLVGEDGNAQLTDVGMYKVREAIPPSYAMAPSSSRRWQAPETLDPYASGQHSSSPTKASDLFSFACTCVEVYTLLPPFAGVSDAEAACCITAGVRPLRPTSPDACAMPESLWKLLQECWKPQASERPSATDVATKLSELVGMRSPMLEAPRQAVGDSYSQLPSDYAYQDHTSPGSPGASRKHGRPESPAFDFAPHQANAAGSKETHPRKKRHRDAYVYGEKIPDDVIDSMPLHTSVNASQSSKKKHRRGIISRARSWFQHSAAGER